jgi:hypothetical protein
MNWCEFVFVMVVFDDGKSLLGFCYGGAWARGKGEL